MLCNQSRGVLARLFRSLRPGSVSRSRRQPRIVLRTECRRLFSGWASQARCRSGHSVVRCSAAPIWCGSVPYPEPTTVIQPRKTLRNPPFHRIWPHQPEKRQNLWPCLGFNLLSNVRPEVSEPFRVLHLGWGLGMLSGVGLDWARRRWGISAWLPSGTR